LRGRCRKNRLAPRMAFPSEPFQPAIAQGDIIPPTWDSTHGRRLTQVHIVMTSDLGHDVMTICTCVSRRPWVESQVGGIMSPCAFAGCNGSLGNASRWADAFRRQPRRYSDAVRLFHNARFFRVVAAAVRQFSPDFIYERYSLWGLAGLGAAKRCLLPFVLEVNAPLVYEQQRYRGGMTCPWLA